MRYRWYSDIPREQGACQETEGNGQITSSSASLHGALLPTQVQCLPYHLGLILMLSSLWAKSHTVTPSSPLQRCVLSVGCGSWLTAEDTLSSTNAGRRHPGRQLLTSVLPKRCKLARNISSHLCLYTLHKVFSQRLCPGLSSAWPL